MRARSPLRFIIMIVPAATLLSGCGPNETVARDELAGQSDAPLVERYRSPAETVGRSDRTGGDPGLSADEIATQIERDMADLARMQEASTSPRDDSPESAASPSATGEVSPDRRILWNTPSRQPAPVIEEVAEDANDNEPTQRESVEPSPLFRDSPPELEVHEPPEAASTADAVGPNQGGTLETDPLDLLLVDVRRELFRRSIDSDQPIGPLLAIASMSIIDPELQMPAGTDRDLSEREAEILRLFHDFCIALGSELDAEHDAESTIVSAVERFQRSLIDERLELPAVEMCWSVQGFGDYEPFDRRAFLAHNEDRFILYLEIDGFRSEAKAEGQWATEIAQQLEIISDRDGIPVWSEPWQTAVDVANKKRRDFFTTQIITIPKALSVGKYHLKVRVRDEKSRAEAEASIPFEMVADPKRAARIPR